MPTVEVPPPYQGPTCGAARIEVEARTVRESLNAVEARYPGFGPLIFDESGKLHRFVRLFLNGQRIDPAALDTPVSEQDEIGVLAAIAGGRGDPVVTSRTEEGSR